MDILETVDLGVLVVMIGLLVVSAMAILAWMFVYVARSRKKETPRAPRPARATSSPGRSTVVAAEVPRDQTAPEVEAGAALRGQFAALSEVGRRAGAAPLEIMKVLRDRVTGAIVVEIEGQKYRTLSEIKDGRVGREVLQTVADLVRFSEVMQPKERAKTAPPATLAQAPLPPAPSSLALKVAPPLENEPPVPRTPAPPSVEQEFLDSLKQQAQQEQDTDKPTLSPIEFFRRGFAARRRAGLQSDMSSPRSFVSEIEDILQRFVRTYPSFIGKEVHVGTAPDGSIQIQVENQFYRTPDDIPDPEIRGIIKAAIQEWEKS